MPQEVYTDLEFTTEPMGFCDALEQLKFGHKVRRNGWIEELYLKHYAVAVTETISRLGIYQIYKGATVFWIPQQDDIFAHDWVIIK